MAGLRPSPAAGELPSVTVIVPTFREAENLPELLERLEAVRETHALELDVIVMDDHSDDGSVEAVASFDRRWARIVVRSDNRGLSPAVVDGLTLATGAAVVIMDADLSHPPEKIPEMLRALLSGQQAALGSRYVPGGSSDDDWGFFRWLNSRVATLLARPLTRVRDPMAGFFAMWRADLDEARELNPVGYKVVLELIVKCGLENIAEIPIHFRDRRRGESKLTLKQQLLYLQHLRRLYVHRFATAAHVVQFAAVGISGLVVNLAVLTLLTRLGVGAATAVALAIAVSMVSNFALNRRLSFSYARDDNVWRQLLGFCAASSVGALVNCGTTLAIARQLPGWPIQLAAAFGVVAGLGFNLLANRFIVFRKRWLRPKTNDHT